MRRNEFSGSPEEASCGVRGELLNRGSQVRIPSPAPLGCASSADASQEALGRSVTATRLMSDAPADKGDEGV